MANLKNSTILFTWVTVLQKIALTITFWRCRSVSYVTYKRIRLLNKYTVFADFFCCMFAANDHNI